LEDRERRTFINNAKCRRRVHSACIPYQRRERRRGESGKRRGRIEYLKMISDLDSVEEEIWRRKMKGPRKTRRKRRRGSQ
jgi:hypothetical protein